MKFARARWSQSIRCAALLFCIALNLPSQAQVRAHFIDVGQGAATLLEFPCAAILVDTGGEATRAQGAQPAFHSTGELTEYLDAFFERRQDLSNTLHTLILTHPHIDHTRGVKTILKRYTILNAVTNGREIGSGRYGQIELHNMVAAGEQTPDDPTDDIALTPVWRDDVQAGVGIPGPAITGPGCSNPRPQITFLWGGLTSRGTWTKADFENGNNHSVVARVDYGSASMLITGDLENRGIGDLTALYAGSRMLDVDVYQVGHHRAENGTTDEFLKVLTPQVAVIAAGPSARKGSATADKYGHPRTKTVNFLVSRVSGPREPVFVPVATGVHAFVTRKISTAIYSTGWDGTVILEGSSSGTWKRLDEVQDDPIPEASLVNVNTASEEELQTLPMIGAARAKAIIASRELQGAFTSIDQLARIRGIGPGTIRILRKLATP